jgi:hypothetical protein
MQAVSIVGILWNGFRMGHWQRRMRQLWRVSCMRCGAALVTAAPVIVVSVALTLLALTIVGAETIAVRRHAAATVPGTDSAPAP